MPDTTAPSPSPETAFAPPRLRGDSSLVTTLKTFAADIKPSHTTFVLILLSLCGLAFITATFAFRILYNNPWPLILSVPVLAFISAYPLLKRFTRLCHYYLGLALALAPLCAWIAIKGDVEMTPLI